MFPAPDSTHRPGCTPPRGDTGQLSIKAAFSAHRTKLWARLPPAPSHPDAALSAGPAPPRDVPGTGRRGGPHGGRRARMGRARLPGLSALWHSGGERIVHRLPYPAPDGTTALSLIDLGVSLAVLFIKKMFYTHRQHYNHRRPPESHPIYQMLCRDGRCHRQACPQLADPRYRETTDTHADRAWT